MDEKFEDSPAGIPKRFVVLQFVDCLNKGLALKHKNTYFSPVWSVDLTKDVNGNTQLGTYNT